MEEADESQRQKGHRKAKLESGKKGQDRKSKTKKWIQPKYIYMVTRQERERHGESLNECM